MISIRERIEGVMMKGDPVDPAFSSLLEWFLYAGSKIYELVVRLRVQLYQIRVFDTKRLPCKVLSIGNLTSGGTGKTPMVHYVAGLLQNLDEEVAVISRGYGGAAQRAGGVVSDGRTTLMGIEESGDEPQLLSSKLHSIPLLVGKDRHRAGTLAIRRFGSTTLVLDDGFQHLSLKRDLNLLLMDSLRPFGNGHCIPRGMLREPQDQIKRANALVLTRWTDDEKAARWWHKLSACVPGRPVFRSNHVPDGLFVAGRKEAKDLAYLNGRRLFLFSGIVRNDSFLRTVSKLDGQIIGSASFHDHHRYTGRDIRFIWHEAKRLNVENIVTTEKDFVNISADIPTNPELLVLKISISFGDDTEAFAAYIRAWVSSFSPED